MIQTVLEWLFRIIGLKQSLRVLCHRAFFLPNGPDCYFINVTNVSSQRVAVVTHVWIEGDNQIPVLNPSRPLPRRLTPEEPWETWIEVERLPISIREDAFTHSHEFGCRMVGSLSQRRTKMFLVMAMFQAVNNAHKRNAASACHLTNAFGTPPPLNTRPTQQFFPPTA